MAAKQPAARNVPPRSPSKAPKPKPASKPTPATPDPVAARLAQITEKATGGQPLKVLQVYGDRPAVLEEIVAAKIRGLSCNQIARLISDPDNGVAISEGAVRNYLDSRRIP